MLARRAWAAALGGVGVSPALLISDLGRPARFLNMLRMFKVTSPMSVGSWMLVAQRRDHRARGGERVDRLVPAARAGGASRSRRLLGLPLCTYTAALLANTAVPVWHEARWELPFVFGSGAALSAGARRPRSPRRATHARSRPAAGACRRGRSRSSSTR